MFESLRLLEKAYLQCLERVPSNRKVKIDINASDSRYVVIFSEIVNQLMKRGDGVQFKLNRVTIDTNRLSVKPLQKIIEFFTQYRIRELFFLEENIDLQSISSSLEEIKIGYRSKIRLDKLRNVRRVNYCLNSEE
jgi:ABC-type Zn uptake system ZnuABC Zn-binding protein ZnuA